MIERYSTRARAVLLLAQQESVRLGHEAVAPEHLLASLIAEGRGIAARTMSALGIGIDAVRREAQASYGPLVRAERGSTSKPAQPDPARAGAALPYSATAKRVLEQAARESAALSDPVVATEHLLLAFTSDGGAAPAQLLERVGRRPEDVRAKVLELREARLGPGESIEAPKPPSRTPVPRGDLPPAGGPPAEASRNGPVSRKEAARRAARSSSRAYEAGARGRWTLVPSAPEPRAELTAGRAAGPRCPGCGGLLEGRLVQRRMQVMPADPAAAAGRASADLASASPAAAANGPAATWLRLVYCASCGHVLRVDGDQGDAAP
jgi:hypothetical protein